MVSGQAAPNIWNIALPDGVKTGTAITVLGTADPFIAVVVGDPPAHALSSEVKITKLVVDGLLAISR